MDLSKLRMDPRRLTSSVQKRDGASGHRRKEGSREKPALAPGVNVEECPKAQSGIHQHENYEQHSRLHANSVDDLTLPPPPANHNWAGPQPSLGSYSGPPPKTISTQTAGFLFVAQTIRLVLKLSQKRAIHSAFQQWKTLAKNDQLVAELTRHEEALVGLQQRLTALCGNEIEEEKASPSPSLPELLSVAPPPWLPNLEVDLPFRGHSNASPALTIVNGSEADSEDSWGDFVSSKNRLSFDATPDNATEHGAFSHRTMLETTFHRVANNSLHFLDQNGWLQVASEHGWDLRGASQAFRHFASMRHGHLGLDFEAFTNAIQLLASDAQRSLEEFLLNTNREDKPGHVDVEPTVPLSSSDSKSSLQNNAEKMVNEVMTGRQQQAALRSLFRTYATVRSNASCLTNARFAKMCRDCGVADLVRSGRLRHADIDLAFTKAVSKAQNHQVADFNTVCRAIGMLGHRAFVCAESDTLSYSDTGFFRLRAHIIATSVEGI